MALNSESPYVGDKTVEELAGITAPNVLRAVAQPPRPDPSAPEAGDSALPSGPEEQVE